MQDIFGGMFDFDRDGHTTWAEEALGLMLFDEMARPAPQPRDKARAAEARPGPEDGG